MSCAPFCFYGKKNLTNSFTIRLEFRMFELVRFGRSGGTAEQGSDELRRASSATSRMKKSKTGKSLAA